MTTLCQHAVAVGNNVENLTRYAVDWIYLVSESCQGFTAYVTSCLVKLRNEKMDLLHAN